MIRDLINLVFPEVCIGCNTPTVKGEELLCTKRVIDLPKDAHNEALLTDKFISTPNIKFGYSFLKFSKKGTVQKLLHHLKYENDKDVGTTLGRWFGADLKEKISMWNPDLLLPIPLHSSRLRTRGYNQSDLIAEGLAEILEIKWSNQVVKRTKETTTQTSKGKVERWKNVDQIFQVTNVDEVNGKKLLVVDDVITTGATINAFADALNQAGCDEIGVLTIARAD